MHYLTAGTYRDAALTVPESLRLDFVRVREAVKEVEKKRRLPKKPETHQRPDIPPQPRPSLRISHQLDRFPIAVPDVLDIRSGLNVGFAGSGEVTPLVRVQPIYPMRAQSRGIEGRVEVEFAINEYGEVSNPRIVAAEPTGIFERATLKAVSRWRYQPQIVDAKPVRRSGVRVVIEFKLEN